MGKGEFQIEAKQTTKRKSKKKIKNAAGSELGGIHSILKHNQEDDKGSGNNREKNAYYVNTESIEEIQ